MHFTSFTFLHKFNIFVGDIDSEVVSSACLLSCVVESTHWRERIPSRGTLTDFSVTFIKFYKAKWKLLPLSQGNPKYKYRLGGLDEIL